MKKPMRRSVVQRLLRALGLEWAHVYPPHSPLQASVYVTELHDHASWEWYLNVPHVRRFVLSHRTPVPRWLRERNAAQASIAVFPPGYGDLLNVIARVGFYDEHVGDIPARQWRWRR